MTTIAGTPAGISEADHNAIQGQVRMEYAKKMGMWTSLASYRKFRRNLTF